MPQVSVIIPTRNRAQMLSEAVESVLRQTFEDFELVIVDDGSTDHTADAVAGFSDPRIVYHRQEKQERGAARNRGVALSKGEYITFLDDDDWYMPRKLETQTQLFRTDSNLGMVISGWDRVNETGAIIRSERPWLHHPQPVLEDWLFAAMAHVAAVLIRRSWFESVGGFSHDLAPAEDTHLWFKLVRAGCPIAWAREVVFRQRLHSSNSVRDMGHVRNGKLAMLDTIFADTRISSALGMSRESASARVYLGFAWLEYAAGLIEDARSDLSKAVEFDPSLFQNGANRLLESIAAYAWNHLTGDPLEFINQVFSNLPDELFALQSQKRRAIARTWMVGTFRAYQYRELSGARKNAFRTIRVAPMSLLNRGFTSILLQSLIGAGRANDA